MVLCNVIRSDKHKTLCNITCYYTALEHAAIASSSHHINERLSIALYQYILCTYKYVLIIW